MRKVQVPNTELSVSRLAFGTAQLHRAGNARSRERLLHAALEAGFSHFDTSPLYGFGAAERALSCLPREVPGITVATKVGLYPPRGRPLSEIEMFLRKGAGKFLPAISRPIVDWSVQRARANLDASLRALRRDQVDILFLHEPVFELIETEEWARWLEDEVGSRVGTFGLAGDPKRIEPFLRTESPLGCVVQCSDSVDGREADLLTCYGRLMQFTFGYLRAHSAQQGGFDQSTVVKAALRRNVTGAVVVGTRRIERVKALARAAEGL